MIPAALIAKKRDGHELSRQEIADFVSGFVSGAVADYQMSAMAMAIVLRGMSTDEVAALTEQMLLSGKRLEWSAGPPKVDKHSTGGLGDKVSLVLAPLLASLGLQVPMISGRGLGITGGTLDKLEAIGGFQVSLTLDEIRDQTERLGCVIAAATEEIAPADRHLYQLRDVTGTVESIPLITASILSKKLAESPDRIVFDVKCGTAAFMQNISRARELGRMLVDVGRQFDLPSVALITDMNQPLGRMVGHAVEVDEAIDTLSGHGPSDLTELTRRLAVELLLATNRAVSVDSANEQISASIEHGRALHRFSEMIEAQGGNLDEPRPRAPRHVVTADRSGVLQCVEGPALSAALVEMGGARRRRDDSIDHSVGFEMLVRVGDPIELGQPLVRLFAHRPSISRAQPLVQKAMRISDREVSPSPLVYERLI